MTSTSWHLVDDFPYSILRLRRRPDAGDPECVAVLGFDDVQKEAQRLCWRFDESHVDGDWWKLSPAMEPQLSQLPTFHAYDPATEGWVLGRIDGRKVFISRLQCSTGHAAGADVELRGLAPCESGVSLDGLRGTVVGGGERGTLVRLPGEGWPGYGRPVALDADNLREYRPADRSTTTELDAEESATTARARLLLPLRMRRGAE